MFKLFQPTHLLFVLVVVLVVFGPKRLLVISCDLGQTNPSLQVYKEELKNDVTNTSAEHEPDKKRPSKRA
jgi:Sec-independent protein translocase protein TatA